MELNIPLDRLTPASDIFLSHLKNRHFLFGFVDVDKDG
jgi:hypothetical protein